MNGKTIATKTPAPKMSLGSKIVAKIGAKITEKKAAKEAYKNEMERLRRIGMYTEVQRMLGPIRDKLVDIDEALDEGIRNPSDRNVVAKADAAIRRLANIDRAATNTIT